VIRLGKLLALRAAKALQLQRAVLSSSWRNSRLLILCYHGISLDDEHIWNPSLYVSPAQFRSRLELLKRLKCNVLQLGEAVERLYAGALPPRAVTITFDDGFYDFFDRAWPLLNEFSFPATVYLATYYSGLNRPVFDLMCRYLLWKGQGKELRWPEVIGGPVLLNDSGRQTANAAIGAFCKSNGLPEIKKHEILQDLAERVNVDLEDLSRRKILHLMSGAEICQVSARTSIELHTHRHQVVPDRGRFCREIYENREAIRLLTCSEAKHFCYPSGVVLDGSPEWLKECGVVSATTCKPGLASRYCDPMLLPRILDSMLMTEDECASWITGLGALIPRRRYANRFAT
jgi:peptidoglycan/xylan/chitin deacetylase (PgdA/CDA1 family)